MIVHGTMRVDLDDSPLGACWRSVVVEVEWDDEEMVPADLRRMAAEHYGVPIDQVGTVAHGNPRDEEELAVTFNPPCADCGSCHGNGIHGDGNTCVDCAGTGCENHPFCGVDHDELEVAR